MDNLKVDRMRYQTNALCFWLCILALVANIIAMIINYGSKTIIWDLSIGFDIVINIAMMLFLFLGAEKSKIYKKDWGIKLAILGIIQVIRIFFIPLRFLLKDQMSGVSFALNIIFLLISAGALAGAAAICYLRATKLQKYLEQLSEGV